MEVHFLQTFFLTMLGPTKTAVSLENVDHYNNINQPLFKRAFDNDVPWHDDMYYKGSGFSI